MYGSDRALLTALPALTDRFRVTLVSAAEGPMLGHAHAAGAEVVVSPDWALRRRNLRLARVPATARDVVAASRLLRRIHRRRAVDLVYANTTANALLPLLRWVLPAPLVVHVREVPRDRGRMARMLLGTVDRVADRVLCNSNYTATVVTSYVPRMADRVRAVPNGIVPLPAVRTGNRPGGVMQVVCVGRIHPKKGQAVLIDAAGRARSAGHRWHLHFWGDALDEHEGLAAELRAAAVHAGLEGSVTWHGYSDGGARLYEGMDVAVVPSVLPEEFSLVTAEAQSAGLPVVATGPGGPSDILVDGETGRIVPAGDAAALTSALVELEDDQLRRRWGSAGRHRILEHFTVDRYAPAVAAELLDVLDHSRSEPHRRTA